MGTSSASPETKRFIYHQTTYTNEQLQMRTVPNKMASKQLNYTAFKGKKVFVDIKWSGRTQVGVLVEETTDKIVLLTDTTHSEISKDSIARLTTSKEAKKWQK